jgi:hypothetical protein
MTKRSSYGMCHRTRRRVSDDIDSTAALGLFSIPFYSPVIAVVGFLVAWSCLYVTRFILERLEIISGRMVRSDNRPSRWPVASVGLVFPHCRSPVGCNRAIDTSRNDLGHPISILVGFLQPTAKDGPCLISLLTP